MEKIFDLLIMNFDFSYMLSVNALTYIIIKTIDDLNGDKAVSVLIKRIVLLISIIVTAIVYEYLNYENTIKLVNSAILAPVAWSWIIRPIFNKFKLGYKK